MAKEDGDPEAGAAAEAAAAVAATAARRETAKETKGAGPQEEAAEAAAAAAGAAAKDKKAEAPMPKAPPRARANSTLQRPAGHCRPACGGGTCLPKAAQPWPHLAFGRSSTRLADQLLPAGLDSFHIQFDRVYTILAQYGFPA